MAGFAPEVLALLSSPKAGVGGGLPHGAFGGPIGNVFYVNGGADGITAGVNAPGRGSKSRPFLTILYALGLCANGHDDYIICWNVFNQDVFPITIGPAKDGVHIIGVAGPNGGGNLMDASVGNTAVFIVNSQNVEIAGFWPEGGAAHAGIELLSGANLTWIHHCTFGHFWAGAGQDGIRFGGSIFNAIIEDNWFYGSAGPNGRLARYGIYAVTGGQGQFTIRRNYFDGLPIRAIELGNVGAFHEGVIGENKIGCGSDAAGGIAILLGASAHFCVVEDNKAVYGKAVMANNPYSDLAADNHWMCNQVGDVMKLPDVAMP